MTDHIWRIEHEFKTDVLRYDIICERCELLVASEQPDRIVRNGTGVNRDWQDCDFRVVKLVLQE